MQADHTDCVHYQYIEGRTVEVELYDWYDYCSAESENK